AKIRQGTSGAAEELFALFARFRRMLGELDDLPLGDAANLIQVQAAPAFDGFRLLLRTKEGISNHGDGGDGSPAHRESHFPIGKELFHERPRWRFPRWRRRRRSST